MALPLKDEVAAATRGLGFVLRGDGRALFCYDLTLDGFWRSFWLPLATLVAYALLMQPEGIEADYWAGNEIGFAVAQGLKFLLAWAVYFAVMAGLSRLYGLGNRFSVFVILYNWAQGITTAVTLPILLAANWDLLPGGALTGWSTALLFVWLFIVFRVARLGLGAALPLAIAASVLDLSTSLLLHRVVDLLV